MQIHSERKNVDFIQVYLQSDGFSNSIHLNGSVSDSQGRLAVEGDWVNAWLVAK